MVPWRTAIVIISLYSISRNLSSVKCLLCVSHILNPCIYGGYLMDPILRSWVGNCKAEISVLLPSPSLYQNPWGCRKSCLLAEFCQANADHSSGILTNWNHLDALTEAKKLTLYCFFQQSNQTTTLDHVGGLTHSHIWHFWKWNGYEITALPYI